jgi:hypothetical protein
MGRCDNKAAACSSVRNQVARPVVSGSVPRPEQRVNQCRAYRRLVETLLKVEFRLVPTPLTAAMIAMAMHVAIRPYSMAVADGSDEHASEAHSERHHGTMRRTWRQPLSPSRSRHEVHGFLPGNH